MGGGSWSAHEFEAKNAARRVTGTAFKHDTDVRQGKADHCHPSMNPNGVRVRESRDSDEHPESNAIMVLIDVTGSMRTMPRIIRDTLNALMTKLTEHGYISHPQVCVGAIGDAHCDRAPVQIGQFESDTRIDDDLDNIYMEGGGGGSCEESYELGLYFAARHTSADCVERRGRKGYLFIFGDEAPYLAVNAYSVKKVFGDDIGQDIETARILEEAQKQYHVFYVFMTRGANALPVVRATWTGLLGDHVVLLEMAGAACELVAAAVGVHEGSVTREQALANINDESCRSAVRTALASFNRSEREVQQG